MKIKKLLLIITLSGAICGYAQDNQKVILKDGSELVGYISRQRPGENLTFTTKRAEIMVNAENVKSIVDHQVSVNNLSNEWKLWADKNDALMGNGDNAYLVLSDIITTKGTVNHVRILERGVKVKYLELIPNNYSLSWDTIARINVAPRHKLQLTGINRKYKLRSGLEYEGQYVEEIPGKTLSLLQAKSPLDTLKALPLSTAYCRPAATTPYFCPPTPPSKPIWHRWEPAAWPSSTPNSANSSPRVASSTTEIPRPTKRPTSP